LPLGYATDIRFAHISTAEGLSQIRVNNIVQDDLGFMWFGTLYGLNRFDGYTFKVFVHDRDNPNSLGGVNILSLFKDRDGALWIGCEQSLDRFDPKTESFAHFPVPMVTYISQDRVGLLWLSTDRGLYRLDQQSGNIHVYSHYTNDPKSLPDNDVRSAAEDRTGRFWVGESDGMYEFDRTSGHVKLRIPIHKPSREFSFYEDRFGCFWILYGSGNGLANFDRESNVLTYWSFHANDTSSAAYSGVIKMLEDRHGNLWLATQGSGLVKFDRARRRFISYTHTSGDSDALAENRITTLFEARDGSIWVALFGSGLQRFSPLPAAFQDVGIKPKEGGIGCFYEDSHRNLWIGTRPALYRIDASGRTTAFVGVKPGVPFDVISVVEDRVGFIWVGTFSNGLFRLDPKTRHWKNYRHNGNDPSSLSNDIVSQLLVDQDGTMWAATWDGLDRFDAGTGHFTTFRADPLNRELIYYSLVEGPEHDLWLGTDGFGLQHFNPKTTQFTTIGNGDGSTRLSDNRVNSIYIERSGAMWVSTQNGLNEFDPVTKHLTVYGSRDGLASSSIDCALEDTRGKLWVSTNRGISSFDHSTGSIRNFSKADGLPGPEMGGWGACLRSGSGRMFFAGFSGATTFLPETVPESSYAPPVVITDFRLLGSPQSLATQSTLHPPISYASNITLSHKQTPFSLTFAALGYSNPQTNRYRYMLEGMDKTWNEVGSDIRSVTYTSLPASTYHFRVQGATNSSQWSEPGATLEITVLPPWWNTWWFQTAGVLAALVVIWSVYRYRMHQIAKQFDIRIEAQVNERTRIARELHDTLLQTIQGSKLVADHALKSSDDHVRMIRAMGQVADWLGRATEEGRAALNSLRMSTTQRNDLAAALRRATEECRTQSPMEVSFSVVGDAKEMHPVVRDEVYRIGYEAIRNACAHSRARRLNVALTYAQDLSLRVSDDGVGIDPSIAGRGKDGHFGLQGMRERAARIAGKLTVVSSANSGTEITVVVPAGIVFKNSNSSPFERLLSILKRMSGPPNSH
jgi:ligand-binding sensor domain-containing protein/signal transduction histidine kinase